MDESSTDVRRLGANVRRARRYRGKSQEELAGLIGHTKGWLSKIENGRIALEKRSDIMRIADALQVSAVDLIGPANASTIPRMQQHGDVFRLRDVLLDSTLDDPPDVGPRPLAELASGWVGPILAARHKSDHAELGRVLPDVLSELHVWATTGDEHERVTALRLIADVCTASAFLLRHNGLFDLAWIAAERARQAAQVLDDPVWRGAALFAQAHCRPSAALPRALRHAESTAEGLEPLLGEDRTAHQVYGMLRLSAALIRALRRDHDGAKDQVSEAQRVADRVGEHRDAWQWFGPANVGAWRTLLAVEAGEPGEALQRGAMVNENALSSRGRRSALHIEMGRAHAMLGRPAAAAGELRKAEQLSAPRVYNNPLVRELVATELDKARREAGGRELRGLAYRMGIA